MPEPDDTISRLRVEREKHLGKAEQLRQQIIAEVRAALPEGEEVPRGLFTRVVNATGWTRAYVSSIRKGDVS